MKYITRTIYSYPVRFMRIVLDETNNPQVDIDEDMIYSTAKLSDEALINLASKSAHGRQMDVSFECIETTRKMSIEDFVKYSISFERPQSQKKEKINGKQ